MGEPINPEAWMWYYKVVGESKCPIVDTWWQTETGGILISPQPGAIDLKPGSATKPFYGIRPVLVDDPLYYDELNRTLMNIGEPLKSLNNVIVFSSNL